LGNWKTNAAAIDLATAVTPAENKGGPRGFCRLNNHADVIPDWLVGNFAIARTVDQCRAQIERIKRTGIQQIAIIPYSCPGEDREARIRRFATATGLVEFAPPRS